MTSPIRKIGIPLVAILLLLAMVAWMAGFFSDKIAPGMNSIAAPGDTDTVTARRAEVQVIEPVPASVEAKQATIISSRIMARINKINVRAGMEQHLHFTCLPETRSPVVAGHFQLQIYRWWAESLFPDWYC